MSKLNSYNICFLGRTGNGKTTLKNSLFGTHFQTDPDLPCTKELYSASFMEFSDDETEAVTVYDTPGIGEYSNNDKYYRFYEHAVSESDCVILVVTLVRTDAPAQRLILSLCDILAQKERKYLIVINHIDSNEVIDKDDKFSLWDDENNCPTKKCQENIDQRKTIIIQNFDDIFPGSFEIIEVCAKRMYNIETLRNLIKNYRRNG